VSRGASATATTVVLTGRRDGTTHHAVQVLATLPPELRLIGGLAVMCRVGMPHRATVDLDAITRDLDRHRVTLEHLALTSTGGGQFRFDGALDLDVIEVSGDTAEELEVELTDGDPTRELGDLELNALAHCWAHDTATAMDLAVVDDDGVPLARARRRLVASPLGLVAMKATTVPLRASSRPEKRASDLYDLARLVVTSGFGASDLAFFPPTLRRAVGRHLRGWFVDEAGRDRTYRDTRRFDEPTVDLQDVADRVEDAVGS
jgi:Nucleotidyl transferase AbiEii toxin, Type IV TA system